MGTFLLQQQEENWQIVIHLGVHDLSFSCSLYFSSSCTHSFALFVFDRFLSKYQQISNYFWQSRPLLPSKRRAAEEEGVDEITLTDVI